MWQAFNNVLEKGGIVAALFFVVIAASGFAIWSLWKSSREQQKEFLDKIEKLTASHDKAIAELTKAHAEAVEAFSQEVGAQIEAVVLKNDELQKRLDAIQERRVVDTKDNAERLMSYIKHFDAFVLKLESAIDVLLRAGRSGR
jgi:hypothetical protein